MFLAFLKKKNVQRLKRNLLRISSEFLAVQAVSLHKDKHLIWDVRLEFLKIQHCSVELLMLHKKESMKLSHIILQLQQIGPVAKLSEAQNAVMGITSDLQLSEVLKKCLESYH